MVHQKVLGFALALLVLLSFGCSKQTEQAMAVFVPTMKSVSGQYDSRDQSKHLYLGISGVFRYEGSSTRFKGTYKIDGGKVILKPDNNVFPEIKYSISGKTLYWELEGDEGEHALHKR